ncbi:MAG: hypothetical protein A2539_10635 [Elusimicrobia bacterium RIFOXYD2_FULL_34_15]|nr:MAG: hypothetical protein A2539_10635 [Elusimicrobia bacterium RIFOXYD2_FULL_34_15]
MFRKVILLLLIYFCLHNFSYAVLIGEWKFGEGDGATASDTSGNNNTGILVNNPKWVNGKVGKALEFDGTNTYIVVNDTAALIPVTSISLEAWVNSDIITADETGSTRRIIEKGAYALAASNQAIFKIYVTTGIGISVSQYLTYPWSSNDIGVWHHVAGTYDSTTGEQKLYQDGVMVASQTIAGLIDESSSYFHIGWQGSSSGRFDGIIDEAKIYDNAITAQEVLIHYQNGNPLNDTTAPTSVNNLTESGITTTSITLVWTAVGDDNMTGTSSSYDIRYIVGVPITSSNWSSATQVTGEPTPKTPGGMETITIDGLTSNTTYYFAVKVGDEVPNWSDLSNILSCLTLQYIDNPPSVAIINPTNGATISGSINFSAGVSDDKGIKRVDFYVDGSIVNSFTITESYSWLLDTTKYTNGSHILKAIVIDTNNQTAISEVTVTISNSSLETTSIGISADISPRETVINPVKGGKSSIKYTIGNKAAKAGEYVHVTVQIYNTRGELVKTLVDQDMEAGNYQSVWDGRNFESDIIASGVYVARLKAGNYTASKKLVVIK